MKNILPALFVAMIVLTGCSQTTNDDSTTTESNTSAVSTTESATTNASTDSTESEVTNEENAVSQETVVTEDGTYTFEEIVLHASADDCWMAIEDGVYDVTEYISSHPGGNEILRGCGTDATAAFQGQGHSAVAEAIKEDYRIGDLAQ